VKTTRLLALPVAVLAAGASLTACGSGNASEKAGAGTPSLKIMVGGLD
jgi:hypothetical protein